MATDNIKVLVVSTSYPKDEVDWRGRFIANILTALANNEHIDTGLWAPPGDIPENVSYTATNKEAHWLAALSERGGIAKSLAEMKLSTAINVIYLLRQLHHMFKRETGYDILHINWLQNTLPLPGDNKLPLVISVLGKDFGLLRNPLVTCLVRRAIRHRKCCITPNASWMVPTLVKHFGDLAQVETVPFGVDPQWFSLDRKININQAPNWITISRVNRDKIGSLFDLGESLFLGSNRQLDLYGPKQDDIEIPQWVNYQGATNPEVMRSSLFPGCCGLITLSRHDEGRPQVMLEAMAAGVPIIASDIPAHRDIIQNGKTGFLVANQAELNQAVSHLENTDNNVKIGTSARQWVRTEIGTWDDCATRYATIYKELLND